MKVFAQTFDEQDSAPEHPIDVSHVANATPKSLPRSRYGNPMSYVVNGKTYHVLKDHSGYQATGYASWYGTKFQGRRTSSGELYDMYSMTAASPTLPIPCFVKVTNLYNNRSVVVKVNDRGPFHEDRILDLSYAAASKLGMMRHGTAHVKVVAIDTETAHKLPPNNYLQVAAFNDSKNAKNLLSTLKHMLNEPITVASNDNDDRSLIYRVLIGPIEQNQLNRIQHMLASNGFGKGFITTG